MQVGLDEDFAGRHLLFPFHGRSHVVGSHQQSLPRRAALGKRRTVVDGVVVVVSCFFQRDGMYVQPQGSENLHGCWFPVVEVFGMGGKSVVHRFVEVQQSQLSHVSVDRLVVGRYHFYDFITAAVVDEREKEE